MPETYRTRLSDPRSSGLPDRPAGEAWQSAEAGLPLPKPVPGMPTPPARRTPEGVRTVLASLRPRGSQTSRDAKGV
ncbi:hypothetical protein ABT234_01420 [Streptomyces sp. NPDC001586]|uniref:hypothetical protein n=1 Tax=unclassified Streptomyces TaxID=2593676 RepID=UPI003327F7EA